MPVEEEKPQRAFYLGQGMKRKKTELDFKVVVELDSTDAADQNLMQLYEYLLDESDWK